MKRALTAVALAFSATYIVDAHALLTRCELSFKANSRNMIVLQGDYGVGTAQCWDAAGNMYKAPFDIQINHTLVAPTYACSIRGQISATGPGFTLDQLFGSMYLAAGGTNNRVRLGPYNGANIRLSLHSVRTKSYYGRQYACNGLESFYTIVTSDARYRRPGHMPRPVSSEPPPADGGELANPNVEPGPTVEPSPQPDHNDFDAGSSNKPAPRGNTKSDRGRGPRVPPPPPPAPGADQATQPAPDASPAPTAPAPNRNSNNHRTPPPPPPPPADDAAAAPAPKAAPDGMHGEFSTEN